MNAVRTNTDSSSEPLEHEAVSSRIYQQLRLHVMRGRFRPNEKLKLRDLAGELGVSLTPVREALVRLISEAALEQVDRRSVRVPVLSERIFREVAELRIDLEGRAAQQAAERATDQDIERLRSLQARLMAARARSDFQETIVANEQFHMLICSMSEMPVLTRLIEGLWLRCGPTFPFISEVAPLFRPEEHPHNQLISSFERKDGIMAKFAIQRDIMTFSQAVFRHMEMINSV